MESAFSKLVKISLSAQILILASAPFARIDCLVCYQFASHASVSIYAGPARRQHIAEHGLQARDGVVPGAAGPKGLISALWTGLSSTG
jgi:hypothetical protein